MKRLLIMPLTNFQIVKSKKLSMSKHWKKLIVSSIALHSKQEIERLNATSNPENWSKVHAEYKRLINRQDRLEFLLPLVSESGYKALFDIKNYNAELSHAKTILVHIIILMQKL